MVVTQKSEEKGKIAKEETEGIERNKRTENIPEEFSFNHARDQEEDGGNEANHQGLVVPCPTSKRRRRLIVGVAEVSGSGGGFTGKIKEGEGVVGKVAGDVCVTGGRSDLGLRLSGFSSLTGELEEDGVGNHRLVVVAWRQGEQLGGANGEVCECRKGGRILEYGSEIGGSLVATRNLLETIWDGAERFHGGRSEILGLFINGLEMGVKRVGNDCGPENRNDLILVTGLEERKRNLGKEGLEWAPYERGRQPFTCSFQPLQGVVIKVREMGGLKGGARVRNLGKRTGKLIKPKALKQSDNSPHFIGAHP